MLIQFTYDNFEFVSTRKPLTNNQNIIIIFLSLICGISLIVSNIVYNTEFNLLILIIGTPGILFFITLFDKILINLAIKNFYSISLSLNIIWFILIASIHNYKLFDNWTDIPPIVLSLTTCWLFYHSECVIGLNIKFKTIFPVLIVIYCGIKLIILYNNKETTGFCFGDNCLSTRDQYMAQVASLMLNFSRKIYHNFNHKNNSVFLTHPNIKITILTRTRENNVEI
jgi:hypothetical protein